MRLGLQLVGKIIIKKRFKNFNKPLSYNNSGDNENKVSSQYFPSIDKPGGFICLDITQ